MTSISTNPQLPHPDTNRAELARFQLTRRGRLVWLEIAKGGRRYQDLLRLWGRRECWDWGEK